jgi:FkbM family methyltransferase
MNGYHLELSIKTKFLNTFRKIFTVKFFEFKLLSFLANNKSDIYKKIIPPDYLYPAQSLRLVTRNEINFKLDISNVVDHNLYFGINEDGFDNVLACLRSANVILDIGSNICSISLFFAKINPKAKILSFEPHPDTYYRAIENIKLNNFNNIELLNIGLGSEKEELKLYEVNNNNPGMNRIFLNEENFPFKRVQVEKLDDVLNEKKIFNIDFIKLDVEGFEYFVLEGGIETLKRNKPIIYIELSENSLKKNGKSSKDLLELLIKIGYNSFIRTTDNKKIDLEDDFTNFHYDVLVT